VNRSVVYIPQYNVYVCKGISIMKRGFLQRMSVSMPMVRLRQLSRLIGHLSPQMQYVSIADFTRTTGVAMMV
jgi:hypothetical protein